jgi:hypothetical protein
VEATQKETPAELLTESFLFFSLDEVKLASAAQLATAGTTYVSQSCFMMDISPLIDRRRKKTHPESACRRWNEARMELEISEKRHSAKLNRGANDAPVFE